MARALLMSIKQGSGVTPAFLQGGGATVFYESTEDGDQLRRGAGSASLQSTDIRIQEVAPYECFTGCSRNTREHNRLGGRVL